MKVSASLTGVTGATYWLVGAPRPGAFTTGIDGEHESRSRDPGRKISGVSMTWASWCAVDSSIFWNLELNDSVFTASRGTDYAFIHRSPPSLSRGTWTAMLTRDSYLGSFF